MPLRFQPARGASVLLSSSSRGPAGASATVTAGTTTTGAQGTSASVSNSGTSSAAVFDFTIPRGSSPAVGWNFDSSTTDADPGAGDFRLNNATAASATEAYFDNTERGGATVTTWLDSWDDTGDSSTRGHLVLMDVATPTTFHVYHVSGSIVDGTGYRKVTISSQGGNGSFTNGNHVSALFLPAGPATTANSFETINCPSGTDPVAETSTDTLNLVASAGLSITGDSSTDTVTFAPANDLAALEALSSTGILARTGSETYAQRTITAPAAGITVSNGDGVSGNPTLALANDLAAYEGLSSTGLVARTGDGTAAARTLTAPAAGITVSNGDGVSGNPTLALADDLAALEALASTGIIARTGSATYAERTITGTANVIAVTDGNGVSGNPTLTVGSLVVRTDTAATFTKGYAATSYSAGTKSTGTYTPDPADGNLQYATNGGAHTLAPQSSDSLIVVQYTNNGSAGSITTSGFTDVSGDSFTTTNGHDFMCYLTKLNGFSQLHVVALQ